MVLQYLASGVLLGLNAGIAPGPLLTLLVSETLRHGFRGGLKIAIAPLITDLPIVAVALLVLSRAPVADTFLGVLSLGGAAFLTWLGWQGLRFRAAATEERPSPPRSLRKGVLTNFLNPHPYMFWLLVGGPTVVKGAERGLMAPAAYLAGFYLLLVGTKVLLALAVDRSRALLNSRGYVLANRCLGALLLLYAAIFAFQGLRTLGVFARG